MDFLDIPAGRRFDLACLGRLAVDLYAQQVGARLEDVASFAKYLDAGQVESIRAYILKQARAAQAAG